MPALVDLSSDIIHEILTAVPDLKSLLSLLLTSKLFNDTFQAHPQSVLRDIASGQVGDALPQALRVVRCEAMNYRREDVKDLPSELDMTKQSITSLEARALVDNAVVANALEDLFSQRYIFNSSHTIVLLDEAAQTKRQVLCSVPAHSGRVGFFSACIIQSLAVLCCLRCRFPLRL